MKFFLVVLTLFAVITVAACERKTSENQSPNTESVNRNTSPPSTTTPPVAPTADSAPQLPPDGQSPENKPVPPGPIKPASFWNPITGEIKDLPSYPGGARMNVQYGPLNGVDSAFILLSTGDPIEKIAAYYDKSAKSAGWTVAERMSDSEMYKLKLKKGDLNEALIQVEKDVQNGSRRIMLSRLEKPKPAANQPNQPKQ